MMRSPFTLLGLSLLGIVPVGLGTTRGPEAEITIKALDYAFEMPEKVRPGRRVLRLVNAGRDLHHVYLFRLEAGKTVADLLGAVGHEGKVPAWAKHVGGPNARIPGAESVAIVDLAPGRYAVLCVIPAEDGKPHVMKGMVKPLEVAGEPVPAPAYRATAKAALDDYRFEFAGELVAGRQVIEFTNRADQAHEAFLARLAPGKKATDLLAWMAKKDGPPPAIPAGGITGIEPGATQTVVVDLEPGTYAWYCFVRDEKDGRDHIAHGMIQEFTVKAGPAAGAGGGG